MREITISIARGRASCLRCHTTLETKIVADLIAFASVHSCLTAAEKQARPAVNP